MYSRQVTDRNMAHAHCMLDTIHSQYVILTAFPLQEWLHKCVRTLSYTHIACLATRTFSADRQLFSQQAICVSL